MKHTLHFTKVSGAGNDFVILENMGRRLRADRPGLVRALCSRTFGVGADGVLVIEPSERVDFTMSYYNADGSYGGMCGNGGRCAARYAYIRGISGRSPRFEALGDIYSAAVLGDSVRLTLREPSLIQSGIKIPELGASESAHFVDTGAPHAVVFVDSLDLIDVVVLGRKIRSSTPFQPAGANVNFVCVTAPSHLHIRTYERGVENETLACGTGATACALVSHRLMNVRSPVQVTVKSGEHLIVSFAEEGGNYKDVTLEGSAHIIFSGRTIYDDNTLTLQAVPFSRRCSRSPHYTIL